MFDGTSRPETEDQMCMLGIEWNVQKMLSQNHRYVLTPVLSEGPPI